MTAAPAYGENEDRVHMRAALAEARRGWAAGEVPVGAVVVQNGEIIGRGYNQNIAANDPAAHAEVVALRAAGARLGNYRLPAACLYVSLEPCIMCAGAILHARLRRVIFGARDPQFGAAGSALNLLESEFLNHRCQVIAGVAAEECGALLTDFFAARRN